MKTPRSLANVMRRGRWLGCGLIALVTVLGGAYGAGCKSSSSDQLKDEGYMERNPIGVPPEAKLVRHSSGQGGISLSPDAWFAPDNVTFRPTNPGQVWVVDEQNATIAFRGRMKAGDRLVVAPKSNEILLNQATVYHRRLPSDHGFLIYFAKDTDLPATTQAASP